MMKKFTSRKFLAMVAGVLTGIGVILAGGTVEGLTAVIASVVSYLIAEGYIDAKAVNTVKDVVDGVADEIEDDNEKEV
jgi:6-phosphofructokinase